jgi:hypothetical protein
MSNMLWPFVRKREEYKAESEVRAFIWEKGNHQNVGRSPFGSKGGDFVDVSLDELIEEIILAPKSDDNFLTQVEQMITNLNLSQVKIRKSQLYTPPI